FFADQRQTMSSYRRQVLTVFGIQITILSIMGIIAYAFWESFCSDTLQACLGTDQNAARFKFLLLSIIRPFLFTPIMVMAMVGGSTFGVIEGTLITALGAALSCFVFYLPGIYLGKRLVRPWLSANLPATW